MHLVIKLLMSVIMINLPQLSIQNSPTVVQIEEDASGIGENSSESDACGLMLMWMCISVMFIIFLIHIK
ncbi:hypothetical protein CAEBREN_17588 [Caenorhabditis brenneri]|uniref:Uncharacterized protein n=1 Tax=Caenorhabditis brenneri TaxID=135651 RepID=G0NSV3_CAEBE|nr:hypothetical protein CAEBREN_17588 [Caenorhabditis brenneri]